MKRKAAIFLNRHLPISEVFIRNQAESILCNTAYHPKIVACRQVYPSTPHSLETYILNQNNSFAEKLSEAAFKLTGRNRGIERAVQGADIIHAHFGPTGWLAAPVASRLEIPLVVTLHGFDVLVRNITFKDGLLLALYKRNVPCLGRMTKKFICVSEYLRKRAIEAGFPEDKCVVNYMGIPLIDHVEEKELWADKSQPFRILSVGRLVPFKGHKYLIEAVAAVQREGYNVHLDIVGDGPLRQELEQMALENLRNFKFHGALQNSETLSLMRQSHILVHTSTTTDRGQTEAFGLVASEAQWAGLPVVAFSSGGVPEAMLDGVTGILCPEKDVRSMKDAICGLIVNDDLRNNMAFKAPDFIRRNFDNAKCAIDLEKIYNEVIAQG